MKEQGHMRADSDNEAYAVGIARAFGGAVIFGLPLLMTMEMWSLGVTTHPLRLLLFLLLNFCVLIILSRFGGFERTYSLPEDLLDALAAYAVGITTATAVLGLFGLVRLDTPINELAGMVAVQSVPASFGAMLARKQLSAGQSDEDEDQEVRAEGYAGQLFLMLAGALFLAFNMAPTEEIRLIGFKMSPWHSLSLLATSLLVLHALVFTIGFAGQKEQPEGYSGVRVFMAFTVPGYGIAVIVSLYILWTFGSIDGASMEALAGSTVVLGFPAAIGAAIARLVV
jgi:putative integral membrane protein (TIGR02587 family)